MRQFFSFAFLSAISYLCHRVFDKSKWNTKDTAFKVDKSLPRLLPYAVCQIVRFDWNFWCQKYRESRDDVAGVLYLFSAKSTDRSLRLVLFAAFWSAVNRGLRPRGTLYFLAAKSTKNSPADACAYFVPSNAGSGRLFAGAHAPRPLRSRF